MDYSVQILHHACFLGPHRQPTGRCQKNIQMLKLHQYWYTSVSHPQRLAQLWGLMAEFAWLLVQLHLGFDCPFL